MTMLSKALPPNHFRIPIIGFVLFPVAQRFLSLLALIAFEMSPAMSDAGEAPPFS